MNRAVFLDRDGTLIEEKDYLHDPAQVVLYRGAPEALGRLKEAGFKFFMVTNQSGVGRGYFTLADVDRVNARVEELLSPAKLKFEKIYVAAEAPDVPSRGRKPSPQFLFDARDEFGLNLAESFMIGDKLSDVECGWNAGVKKSILVRTGYGAAAEKRSPTVLSRATIANDLAEAADKILAAG
jgi:D-glycero-D-manno-heptose 1,7-bisphosphate phosphatase